MLPASRMHGPMPQVMPRRFKPENGFLDRRTGFAESERSGERLPTAAHRASKASQLTRAVSESG